MIKKYFTFTLAAVLILSSVSIKTAHATPSSYDLNIDSVVQEEDYWCWAATTKCISDYLGGNGLSQTEIVESVKGSAVDKPANASEQKEALNNDGVTTTYTNDYISMSSVRNMIYGWSSPILAHIAWTNGGAHAVVIYGYDSDNDLLYMDPAEDDDRWNAMVYSSFVDNSEFNWVRTFYKNTVS